MGKNKKTISILVSVIFVLCMMAECLLWRGENIGILGSLQTVAWAVAIITIAEQELTCRRLILMLFILVDGLVFALVSMPVFVALIIHCCAAIFMAYLLFRKPEDAIGRVLLIALIIVIVSSVWIVPEDSKPSQTVVLENVDVKSKNNIYISLEGGNIFRVSSKVAKDWDYQAGDTVKVVIYNDEIISCERK